MVKFAVVALVAAVALPVFGQLDTGPRDPLLMGVASFVVPGLGQALQGDFNKGLTHFLVAAAISVGGYYIAWYAPFPFALPLVGLAELGWAFYSAADSYQMAVEYNQEHGFSLGIEYRFSLGGRTTG